MLPFQAMVLRIGPAEPFAIDGIAQFLKDRRLNMARPVKDDHFRSIERRVQNVREKIGGRPVATAFGNADLESKCG